MVGRTVVELVVELFDFMFFWIVPVTWNLKLNHVLHICPIGNVSHSSLLQYDNSFDLYLPTPLSVTELVTLMTSNFDTDIVFTSVRFTSKYV